jgi:hypothetical protein
MFTLLKGIMCWEKYQKETATSAGVFGMPIAWGNGPREYPALVTTYVAPQVAGQPPKLISCYVYESDALALLAAKGGTKIEMKPATKDDLVKGSPSQSDFNRWVSSYLLALVRELREIGALKAESFEQSLAEALQLVDEVATEKRDQLMKNLPKDEKSLLDRLDPPEQTG